MAQHGKGPGSMEQIMLFAGTSKSTICPDSTNGHAGKKKKPEYYCGDARGMA